MFLVLLDNHAKLFRCHTKQKRANCYYEYSSFYKLTTQNNFALAQSRNALIVIMNVPKTISLSQSRNALVVIMNIPRAISYPSKTISLSGKQSRNALIMQSEFELAVIVIANSYNIARSKYKHTLCILRSIRHPCKKFRFYTK